MTEPTPIAVAAIERNKVRIAEIIERLTTDCEELLKLMCIDKIHTVLVDEQTRKALYQISIMKVKEEIIVEVPTDERT